MGVDYNFSSNWTGRFEYQRVQDVFKGDHAGQNDINIDSLFLGLAYRFGGAKASNPTPEVEPLPAPTIEETSEPVKQTKVFKEYGTELFALNSSQLSPDSLSYFDKIIETMKAFPQAQLKVIGHTDSTGDADYNQQLSQQRAQSVAQYISSNGVDASRILAIGEGANRPKASNETREGRLENRRVEVIIDEFEYEVN